MKFGASFFSVRTTHRITHHNFANKCEFWYVQQTKNLTIHRICEVFVRFVCLVCDPYGTKLEPLRYGSEKIGEFANRLIYKLGTQDEGLSDE
jgi:hypothetical protein